jgi:succinyl-diaminopimelate desuccinylase
MTDTLTLLQDLIRCESVTPIDAGCQDLIAARLQPLGFNVERLDFADTQNIWLRKGEQRPLLTFLGHTDVVPPGPLDRWNSPPFEPTIRDNQLYGRGAADMKGGIACFITALERFLKRYPDHKGSIAKMLTSD